MAKAWGMFMKQEQGIRRFFFGMLAAVCLFMLVDVAAAAPKTVISKTDVHFGGIFADSNTGGLVSMFGTLQLTTKLKPATNALVVTASLRKPSTVAFSTPNPPPTDPLMERLEELKLIAVDLKAQIPPLKSVIFDLQVQLNAVLMIDVDPIRPGRQPDKPAIAAIKAPLAQAVAALETVTKQLQEVQLEMKEITNQINQREKAQPTRTLYKTISAPNNPQDICSILGCERFVKSTLKSSTGAKSDYVVRMNLLFSPRGELIAAQPYQIPIPLGGGGT